MREFAGMYVLLGVSGSVYPMGHVRGSVCRCVFVV